MEGLQALGGERWSYVKLSNSKTTCSCDFLEHLLCRIIPSKSVHPYLIGYYFTWSYKWNVTSLCTAACYWALSHRSCHHIFLHGSAPHWYNFQYSVRLLIQVHEEDSRQWASDVCVTFLGWCCLQHFFVLCKNIATTFISTFQYLIFTYHIILQCIGTRTVRVILL